MHISSECLTNLYVYKVFVYFGFLYRLLLLVPSVIRRCWLGGRKGIQPLKTEWWGAGIVICLERGADLHMAQLMPLPLTVPCFSKIQIGFTFLVPAHLGSPGKRAIKWVCVCVCACACVCYRLLRPSVAELQIFLMFRCLSVFLSFRWSCP